MGAEFEAVIFDCDGVLIDSEPIAAAALARALTGHGLPMTRDEVYLRFLGRSFPTVEAAFLKATGRPIPDGFRTGLHAGLMEEFRRSLRAMEGVDDLLRRLSLRRAVASSSAPDRLFASLDLTGLRAHFGDHIYDASMVARGKPAPDLFLMTARRLQVDPARIAVVEDSRAGVEAAVAAGMTAWGFTGGSHFEGRRDGTELSGVGASRVFPSMRELAMELLTSRG